MLINSCESIGMENSKAQISMSIGIRTINSEAKKVACCQFQTFKIDIDKNTTITCNLNYNKVINAFLL